MIRAPTNFIRETPLPIRELFTFKMKRGDTLESQIWTILLAAGIPSTIIGGIVGSMIKRMERRMDEKEQAREQQELYLVKGINASIALGEATAEAVARIPDAHCNGDMHAALDYAKKIKHEQKDFLQEQAVHALV